MPISGRGRLPPDRVITSYRNSQATRLTSPAARSSQSVAVVITGGFRCSGWEEDPVAKPVREPLLVDLACRYREHCFNGVVGVGLLVVP